MKAGGTALGLWQIKRILNLKARDSVNFLILIGLNLLEHPQILLVEQIQPGVI